MKKHTDPPIPNCYYHVFNRGINGEDIFKEERNYNFFLSRYAKYILPIADTFAYCLLKNHFHIMIRTFDAQQIIQNIRKLRNPNVGRVRNPADVIPQHEQELLASKLISRQFSHLFNSYAQSINKAYNRTGGLFEEPFRRVPLEEEGHANHLIYYIHTNAQKHKFVKDFRSYPHSSYHAFFSSKKSKLKREEVLSWFGRLEYFTSFHLDRNGNELDDLKYLEIEE